MTLRTCPFFELCVCVCLRACVSVVSVWKYKILLLYCSQETGLFYLLNKNNNNNNNNISLVKIYCQVFFF